jgi:hypothetical protein
VSRFNGDQWVYSAILADSEQEFSVPVYSNYGNGTDITQKTLVPATGLVSSSPYKAYPTVYSVYVEAERVLTNSSASSNFQINSVNHGSINIRYEVLSLAPQIVLGMQYLQKAITPPCTDILFSR